MHGGALQFLAGQMQTPPLPSGDLTNQTVLITGANSGLGLDAAKHLARLHPATLILAVRSPARGAAARDAIIAALDGATPPDIQVWPLDLSVPASIAAIARRAAQELSRLDAVLLNAGVLARAFATTALGDAGTHESMVATNVLGTFALALALLPMLRATAAAGGGRVARLCFVGSAVHAFAPTGVLVGARPGRVFADVTAAAGRAWDAPAQYNVSKLLGILCFRELAARVALSDKPGSRGVVVNCVHPGYCRTPFHGADASLPAPERIGLALIGRDCEVGSRCLADSVLRGKESHGQYLAECRVKYMSQFVRSKQGAEVQNKVWADMMDLMELMMPGASNLI